MEEINEQATVTREEEKELVDPKLYKQASRRVAFKSHVFLYILINLLLWVVWAFIFRTKDDTTFFTCILFVTIVWFIILMVHYIIVYRGTKSMVEKELKKLQKEIQDKSQEEIN